MEDKIEQIKSRLHKEGYSIINVYDDPPNEVFEEHSHAGDQLMVIVSGEIEVEMNSQASLLKAGEEMYFPAGVLHSAKVGVDGCLYIDGEKPLQDAA